MIVKTTPNGRAFREGYLRTARDGVFRLYETPPDRPDDPFYDHARRQAFGETNTDIPEQHWPRVDPRCAPNEKALKEDRDRLPESRIYRDIPGPSRMQKWLGPSLVEATEREKAEFAGSDADVAFAASGAARDPDAVMNRGAQIAAAVGRLDHENPDHWTQDGLPKTDAVEALSGLTSVRRHEIVAVAPAVVRDPKPAGR